MKYSTPARRATALTLIFLVVWLFVLVFSSSCISWTSIVDMYALMLSFLCCPVHGLCSMLDDACDVSGS